MSETITLIVYTCDRCGVRKAADSVFEADKPVGFYLDLLKVTGEKYPRHFKTSEQVFFCTKECLIEGLQFGISGMVKETVPIGLAPRQRSPWR